MHTLLRWRSRIPWGVTASLLGTILLLGMGLPWMHGSATLMSHGTPVFATSAPPAWGVYLERMDAALSHGALQAAQANWLMAHLEAGRVPSWEGWLGVGDAALRLGEAEGRETFALRARQVYRKALRLATEQGSRAGVLAAADAFATLGDRSTAEALRTLARKLSDPRS